MKRGFNVFIIGVFYLVCCYFVIQGLTGNAHAQTVIDWNAYVEDSNKVNTTDGRKAKILNFTDYNKTTGTATGQFKVVNPDGSQSTISKTLRRSASKFKQFGTICLRSPLACVGAAAMSYAATELMNWWIDENYEIYPSAPPTTDFITWPTCGPLQSARVEQPSGVRIRLYQVDTNCKLSETTTSTVYQVNAGDGFTALQVQSTTDRNAIAISHYYSSNFIHFAPESAVGSIDYPTATDANENPLYTVYARITVVNEAVNNVPQPEPIPESTLAQNLATAEALQVHEAGALPNIWEPVDLTGYTFLEEGEVTDPELQPEPDPQPEPEEGFIGGNPADSPMTSLSDIPEEIRDVTPFFVADGFLDAQCPAPVPVDFMNSQFEITFDPFCSASFVAKPFIVLAGMIAWLVIVWRGLGDGN